MRILHCIPSLSGGGAERQCVYLCRELSVLGVEVHVATVTYEKTFSSAPLSSVATVHVLGSGQGTDIRQKQRNLGIPFRLISLMQKIQPDLVQTWNRPMDLYAGIAAVVLNRPWILSERNTGVLYTDARENLRRLVAKGATAIASNSEGGQIYWKNHIKSKIWMEIIPNMLPLQRIREEAARAEGPANNGSPTRILYVGRFDAQKNIKVMMEGLCRAVSSFSAEVILLGDGPLRDWAKNLVTGRGLGAKFHFMGYQDPPWAEMRRASMLVLASRFEGHPNVVCEAMAVGCPVIISDIPAHRALFNDQHALFVHPDDPEGIARAIRKIISDPSQAMRRAAEAGRVVSQWSPEIIARRYLSLYTSVTNGKYT